MGEKKENFVENGFPFHRFNYRASKLISFFSDSSLRQFTTNEKSTRPLIRIDKNGFGNSVSTVDGENMPPNWIVGGSIVGGGHSSIKF